MQQGRSPPTAWRHVWAGGLEGEKEGRRNRKNGGIGEERRGQGCSDRQWQGRGKIEKIWIREVGRRKENMGGIRKSKIGEKRHEDTGRRRDGDGDGRKEVRGWKKRSERMGYGR